MSGNALTVAFLDVGQGDSTVVLLPGEEGGRKSGVVIDCPCGKHDETRTYVRNAGVGHLPYVVVTHSDADHVGGMPALLSNLVETGGVSLGAIAFHNDTTAIAVSDQRRIVMRKLLEIAERYGTDDVPTVGPLCGNRWEPAPGVVIEVLHPSDLDIKSAQLKAAPNNASVVLRISFANRCFLLPGDLGGDGWRRVLKRKPSLKADFFRFPHHGAWYTPQGQQPSLDAVLQQVDPEVVVISVGTGNIYDHPHPTSVQLLGSMPRIQFAHTQSTPRSVDAQGLPWPRQFSDSGTVEIVVDAEQYSVYVLADQMTRTQINPK